MTTGVLSPDPETGEAGPVTGNDDRARKEFVIVTGAPRPDVGEEKKTVPPTVAEDDVALIENVPAQMSSNLPGS